MALSIIPPIKVTYISIEKYLFANSLFPSPNVLETKAFPPAPIIKPTALTIDITGNIKLTAEKAVVPVKLEINKPSTITSWWFILLLYSNLHKIKTREPMFAYWLCST